MTHAVPVRRGRGPYRGSVPERVVSMRGPTYLAATTALLQRARRQAPAAGLWEAADLQWWWRRPRSSDHLDQSVVIDEWDRPLATVALTDWGDRWACDPLVVADRAADLLPSIWPRAQEALELVAPAAFETSVRDDDPLMADLAISSGFGLTPARYAETWMAAGDRPPVPSLHDGYRLSDRVHDRRRPHHLVARNGPDVAARLAQTSLYRPELDLCIRDHDGAVAAYGLFWYDPSTAVGLVEPMRAEEPHQRRGLARHLLAEGLARLAARGATRMKVSYELDNPAAEQLYLSTGFTPESTSSVYVRRVDRA